RHRPPSAAPAATRPTGKYSPTTPPAAPAGHVRGSRRRSRTALRDASARSTREAHCRWAAGPQDPPEIDRIRQSRAPPPLAIIRAWPCIPPGPTAEIAKPLRQSLLELLDGSLLLHYSGYVLLQHGRLEL